MKTLMLRDGDLVVSKRDYVTVSGTGKIAQDLRGAMLEPMGNDRFHTGWGSLLDQAIASVVNEDTRLDIEAEVGRIISNYAAVQNDRIDADIAGGGESRYTTDEILSRIVGVSVELDFDKVRITVKLQTAAGEVVVLNESIG